MDVSMISTRFNTTFEDSSTTSSVLRFDHCLSSLVESVGVDDGPDGLISSESIFKGLSEAMAAMDDSPIAAFASCKAASHV